MTEELVINYQFPWYMYFTLLAFTLGACFGSFLNVCIYRIPREIPTGKPSRSFCPSCEKTIPWYLNIPLVSYLMLRGKCRFCNEKISIRYFLVEALTAVLFILVWLKYDDGSAVRVLGLHSITNPWLVPVYCLVVFGLILGTFVDIEFFILPDRVTLGGIAAGLIFSALLPALHGAETVLESLKLSLVGGSVGWFSLWGVAIFGKMIFKKEAMGFGDVKLLGAIGAFLGWRAVLFNIFISSLLGSIIGVSFVAAGKREMGSRIPFGPFIAVAALIWIFWGPTLWQAYMNLMLPPVDTMGL